MIYSLCVIAVLVTFAVTVGLEGLWSGVIMSVNVLVAGIVATAFFEPLAQMFQGFLFGATFYWDMFWFFTLFGVTGALLKHISDLLARRQLKYPDMVNKVGGIVSAVLCGWIAVSFFSLAMQTAPMEPKPLGESFVPGESNFFGIMAPDYQWAYFFQHVASGSLAPLLDEDPKNDFYVNSPKEFFAAYEERRKNYAQPRSVGAGLSGVGVGSGEPPLPEKIKKY